mmetsp:Transcript_28720/g.53982  ORF Transcript_28720/g.53982 Transcript_28720/m.53982 type:complete len:473 (+) Transcript_28720:129-1547(+)
MKFSTIALAAFAAKSSFVMAKDNQHVSSVVNLRSPSTIEDRVLHPDSWYYQHNEYDHAQCTRPQPICDDCGYKRDQDYYHAMIESSQVEDGQLYTPPDTEIKCGGETLSGFVKLTSNLVCDNAETEDYTGASVKAITISGPGSVLDCDGNTIMMPVGTASSLEIFLGSVGIVLENGATAVNCNVVGFSSGVWFIDGDTVFKNSVVGGATNNNIVTTAEGSDACMVIDGVESIGATNGNGLVVTHGGTMQIYDSSFTGNNLDGVSTPEGINLCFSADKVDASGNSDGFDLRHNGATDIKRSSANFNRDNGVAIEDNSTPNNKVNLEDVEAIGNADDGIDLVDVDISTFGTVSSFGSGVEGLEFICGENPCELNVNGDLLVEGYAQSGIFFGGDEAISVSVKECAFLKACPHEDPADDIGADDSSIVTWEGDATCGSFDSDITGLHCTSCPNEIGTGTICTSHVAAFCYPKPEW